MSFLIPFEYHNGDCIDGMTVVNPVAQGGNGDLYLVRDEAENLLVLKIIRKTDNHDELSGIEQCRAVSSHVPELVPILKTGKLFAAGLDVFPNNSEVDPELLELPNVVLTPHIGSNTNETRREMSERIVSIVKAVCDDEAVLKGNLVNAESLKARKS